jgi:hypothetical protein
MLGAECRPRALCVAQHCGERDHLNDDLHIVTLPQELIQSPDLWPKVSRRITAKSGARLPKWVNIGLRAMSASRQLFSR